jgi:hypothetical protein
MCFSNLPIEFDEEGNPRLAEEAEEVERPACGCIDDAPALALDEDDPEEAFEEIVESVPDEVRARLDASGEDESERLEPPRPEAGGD